MKIDPKIKWIKTILLKLDRKLLSRFTGQPDINSTLARSIELYEFRNSRSEFWPMLMYLFKVSFLTTLDIYKTYFKSRHIRIRWPRVYFFYEKILLLYAIGFCNHVLPDFHYWWSEELCSQQQSFKLLELVTY